MEEQHIPFKAISCGKLRRYFSWKNFVDFFKIPVGIVQALFILKSFRPHVIFCKGGFVCFPVAVAGWMLRVPVILHESDVSPGLANRLCARFAHTICISWPESRKFFPDKRVILTGNPVRRELAFGNREDGLKFTDFTDTKKTILFMGGSSGAEFINQVVLENFDYLLRHYQIIHICGEGKVKDAKELLQLLEKNPTVSPVKSYEKFLSNYRAFSFVGRELKDLYALADVIVARAGSISLAEIDFFNKPVLLIPLPRSSSRGDQIDNAKVYAKHHACCVLEQENYSSVKFRSDLEALLHLKMGKTPRKNKFEALEKIVEIIENFQ
jgi:UDP-N-acetylglucosamine--N-acetylmuramyl-(pentapeptide) pyrophosphoryl-undecaprenol N-acetylglucosamine transferase